VGSLGIHSTRSIAGLLLTSRGVGLRADAKNLSSPEAIEAPVGDRLEIGSYARAQELFSKGTPT
jgi:hypothetical protein